MSIEINNEKYNEEDTGEYIIKNMDKSTALKISKWQYDEPFSIYSLDGSEETINHLMNGFYFSAYRNNQLVGYFCFGKSSQVPAENNVNAYLDDDYLDVGLGLKPELCGQGKGYDFFRSGLKFAVKTFSKNKFRLTVALFNKRAIKLYRKIGFRENNICFAKKVKGEDIEFIIMTLEDWLN